MIEINNLTKSRINEKILKKTSEKVLKREKREIKSLSIVLIGQARIKELNKKYRKKNRPTDILSFSYDDSGEIVICPEMVKKNAGKYGLSPKKELVRVLVHGILHLLGYDHDKTKKAERKMIEKENYYLKLCQRLI